MVCYFLERHNKRLLLSFVLLAVTSLLRNSISLLECSSDVLFSPGSKSYSESNTFDLSCSSGETSFVLSSFCFFIIVCFDFILRIVIEPIYLCIGEYNRNSSEPSFNPFIKGFSRLYKRTSILFLVVSSCRNTKSFTLCITKCPYHLR